MRNPSASRMFDAAFISNVTDYVDNFNSHAIPVTGNAIILEATLHESSNLGATDLLTLSVESTYDGRVWKSVYDSSTNVVFNSDGVQEDKGLVISSVDEAYVRVRAALSGTATMTAIFSATLVCSSQA